MRGRPSVPRHRGLGEVEVVGRDGAGGVGPQVQPHGSAFGALGVHLQPRVVRPGGGGRRFDPPPPFLNPGSERPEAATPSWIFFLTKKMMTLQPLFKAIFGELPYNRAT